MEFEKTLNYLLQRDVTFILNNKVYKKGKILLYTLNDFYLYFVLKTDFQQNKNFEVPVPFDIRRDGSNVIFDYTFDTLSKGNSELFYRLRSATKEKNAKLYNTTMQLVTC